MLYASHEPLFFPLSSMERPRSEIRPHVKELPWEEAVYEQALYLLRFRYLGKEGAAVGSSPAHPKRSRDFFSSPAEAEREWNDAVQQEYAELERFYESAIGATDLPTDRAINDQASYELDLQQRAQRLGHQKFSITRGPLTDLLGRAYMDNPILYRRIRNKIDLAKRRAEPPAYMDPFEAPTRSIRLNTPPRQPQEPSPPPAARQQTPEQREIERRWYFQYLPALKKLENPDALVPGGFDEIQRKVRELEQNPRLVASLRELRRKYGDWNG
jgi:hypothetical protein